MLISTCACVLHYLSVHRLKIVSLYTSKGYFNANETLIVVFIGLTSWEMTGLNPDKVQ